MCLFMFSSTFEYEDFWSCVLDFFEKVGYLETLLIDGDLSGLTGSLTEECLTILPSSPFTEEIENIFFISLFLPTFLELFIEIFELLTVTGDPALSFD